MIVSFRQLQPPARFDSEPWTTIEIQEAPAATGSWTLIDTQDLDPVDSDPTQPQERNITTTHGTAASQWYRFIYGDATAGVSAPSEPVWNADLTQPFATVDELFRVLKVRNPTTEQTNAATGDLETASLEILSEIDLGTDLPMFGVDQVALINGVCIDRAADLWRHRESAPGILGVVDEGIPTAPGRYSFARYVARLSVLKDQWGIS